MRLLNKKEMASLVEWLQEHNVQAQRLHREFSDGSAAANLLKKFYPKLVDLHNYPHHNNYKSKLVNWDILNRKVLTKIGLELSKMEQEHIAKCSNGAIQIFLYDVMRLILNDKKEGEMKKNQDDLHFIGTEQAMVVNDEIVMVPLKTKVNDVFVKVPKKFILYSNYDNVRLQLMKKDEYLQALQQKITHLENMLQLKVERIDELCNTLARLSVNNLLKSHNLDESSETTLKLSNLGDLQEQLC